MGYSSGHTRALVMKLVSAAALVLCHRVGDIQSDPSPWPSRRPVLGMPARKANTIHPITHPWPSPNPNPNPHLNRHPNPIPNPHIIS